MYETKFKEIVDDIGQTIGIAEEVDGLMYPLLREHRDLRDKLTDILDEIGNKNFLLGNRPKYYSHQKKLEILELYFDAIRLLFKKKFVQEFESLILDTYYGRD